MIKSKKRAISDLPTWMNFKWNGTEEQLCSCACEGVFEVGKTRMETTPTEQNNSELVTFLIFHSTSFNLIHPSCLQLQRKMMSPRFNLSHYEALLHVKYPMHIL